MVEIYNIMSRFEKYSGRYDKPISRRQDFGARIVPEFIVNLKRQHGADLVGEIVETKSGTHYVIRRITKDGVEATQLGDYTKSRPHIVLMPNDARGILADPIRNIALATSRNEYRKILLEIKEEGGDVEIPPEKKIGFDIF